MNRQEHLLFIIAEECVETAQRASKAARFGMDEVQPGQEQNNAERILQEYGDLIGVIFMLKDHCPAFKKAFSTMNLAALAKAKREKVEKFLAYSEAQGLLHPEVKQ